MTVGRNRTHRIQHGSLAVRQCSEKQISKRPYASLNSMQERRPDGSAAYAERESISEMGAAFDCSQHLNHFYIEQAKANDVNDYCQGLRRIQRERRTADGDERDRGCAQGLRCTSDLLKVSSAMNDGPDVGRASRRLNLPAPGTKALVLDFRPLSIQAMLGTSVAHGIAQLNMLVAEPGAL